MSCARRVTAIALTIPGLLLADGITQNDEQAPPTPTLTVRIYDYAGLSEGLLRRAGEKARRVYRRARIETVWRLCRVSLSGPTKDTACEREPDTTVLQMRILPAAMAERFGLDNDVFGFALPPRGQGFGNVASVFYRRVEKFAETSGTAADVILGYALAHEAGHLLLGISSHSSDGIMHVPWRVDDLKRAEVGSLRFTPQQADQMRRQLLARGHSEKEATGLPDSPLTPGLFAPRRTRLRVRIYDYAHVEPKLLEHTREQAREVLEGAGVDTTWEQCHTSDLETNKDRSCRQPAGPDLIQLRIHPREMARKISKRSIEFGYALSMPDNSGVIAGVYLERAEVMAKSLGLDGHVVLGHTIAHEIGHLLLGSNSHSKTGIMKARWSASEIYSASQGNLHFTATQASRMQAGVAERLHENILIAKVHSLHGQ